MPSSTDATESRRRAYYRWDVRGGICFVTTVTCDRRPVFVLAKDAQLALDTLRAVREVRPFKMLGYAILPDHVHLLMQLGEDTSVSALMHSFKRNVTWNYKHAHAIAGAIHLWQKGYWARLVLDERELEPILAYIHYNPVKHGIVHDAVDYSFTSWRVYQERKGSQPGRRQHDLGIVEQEPDWIDGAEP